METTSSKPSKLCFFCCDKESKYSCPRCGEFYCSLDCYKCEKHAECSESFYRDCVTEELTGSSADDESRKKMMEILTKMHNHGDDYRDAEDFLQGLQEDASGTGSSEDNEDQAYNGEELDSDDEEFLDLKDRMDDINLDDPEAVWNALTEDERNEFEALVSGGEVSKLVPLWEPWWCYHKDSKLVEEINDSREEEEALTLCPRIKDVPELTALSKLKPAECVKYNIINVIAAYAFMMRYFNGEQTSKELVPYLLSVCGCLSKNSNFEDEENAVGSVRLECLNSAIIETDDTSLQVMKQDLYQILKGPSKENQCFYTSSALSDLHRLLSAIKKAKNKTSIPKNSTKQEKFSKKFPQHGDEHLPALDQCIVKNFVKKIEYYLSYIKSYGLPMTRFVWERLSSILGTSQVHFYWDIPDGAPSGTYRIHHCGESKLLIGANRPYEGTSDSFVVTLASCSPRAMTLQAARRKPHHLNQIYANKRLRARRTYMGRPYRP